MSVYFSSIKINKSEFAVPSQAGWWEGRRLRYIHSFRPKPAGTDEDLSYQSEILNEHSNEVLNHLAARKMNVEANFISNNNKVSIRTELVGNSRDLQSVDFESTKTRWEWYEDCFSFFYCGNRIYTLPLGEVGHYDALDQTRDEGWYQRQNISLMPPFQITKTFDHMLLAALSEKREDETKQKAVKFFDVFKSAGLDLQIKYLGNIKWAFWVGKNPFDDLGFRMRETISFALDFYVRLLAVKKDFESSAICLIENASILDSGVMKRLFPNVQFITD